VLRPQLAASIGQQELARIEPVHGLRAREDRREITLKFRAFRAAILPQGASVRRRVKTQDLLHPAIAVRGDHQKMAWQPVRWVHPEEHVVVELSLLPMREELEPTEGAPELVEQRSEDQGLSEGIDAHGEIVFQDRRDHKSRSRPRPAG
jgi:hypothetical protein